MSSAVKDPIARHVAGTSFRMLIDGERIGIIDFGMHRRIAPEVLAAVRKNVLASVRRDPDLYADSLVEAGMVGPADVAAVKELARISFDPAYYNLTPQEMMNIDFGEYFRRMRAQLVRIGSLRLPDGLVMWSRALSLLYGLLVFLLSAGIVAGLIWLAWDFALFPAIAGFLVFAPALAIGLYDKSRALEVGEQVSLRHMLLPHARAGGQVIFTGALLCGVMLLWMRAAVIIYALFFGVRPFPGHDAFSLSAAVLEGRLAPVPSDRRVPAFVRAMVMRRVEESCRQRGADRVTVELLEEIRARMPTPKVFGC